MVTKTFPAKPLNAIPSHGRFIIAFRNRQPQASMRQIIFFAQQGKVFITDLAGTSKDLFKLGRPKKPLVPSKSPGNHRRETPRYYAESTLRPLARRAFKILRPAAVAMRARKPCLRARFKVLG